MLRISFRWKRASKDIISKSSGCIYTTRSPSIHFTWKLYKKFCCWVIAPFREKRISPVAVHLYKHLRASPMLNDVHQERIGRLEILPIGGRTILSNHILWYSLVTEVTPLCVLLEFWMPTRPSLNLNIQWKYDEKNKIYLSALSLKTSPSSSLLESIVLSERVLLMILFRESESLLQKKVRPLWTPCMPRCNFSQDARSKWGFLGATSPWCRWHDGLDSSHVCIHLELSRYKQHAYI